MVTGRPLRGMLLGLLGLPLLAAANDLAPADFLWRATLEAPSRASLVRVQVPGEALMRLQTTAGHDLRVFDGQGQRVPFAFSAPTPPAVPERQATPLVAALSQVPLSGGRPPRGAVLARLTLDSVTHSLGLRPTDGADAAAPTRSGGPPVAVFDTREFGAPWTGFIVEGRMPANAAVALRAWVSDDLVTWQPVPVAGRLYRFDGEDAPVNDTLEFPRPLDLQGRYLRLDWPDQPGVRIEAVTGLIGAGAAPLRGPVGTLPDPLVRGPVAAEWHLGFATPIAELLLQAERPDTLAPVRVLGRNRASEPWRPLAHGLVYRQGSAGREALNGPITLPRVSMRLLRVEATHGSRLDKLGLRARVRFDPLEVVFVAAGMPPYQLAVGRAYTPPAAMPISMLAATAPTGIDALPQAGITQTNTAPPPPPPLWQRWLPTGVDSRAAGLWLVLGTAALSIIALTWSLRRRATGG